MKPSFTKRFEAFIMPDMNYGCWLWTGTMNSDGYGNFGVKASCHAKAHRVSYEIYKGKIPPGLIVRHKCDNPSCVNPDHLELGTHADNSSDRSKRNRTALGAKNGKSVLKPEQVYSIRSLASVGMSERVIAREIGVHRGTVNAVLSGRTWAHLH